jgi:hypothetical protein
MARSCLMVFYVGLARFTCMDFSADVARSTILGFCVPLAHWPPMGFSSVLVRFDITSF